MPQREYNCQEDILCGVNLPKDMNNLTELEEKHLPIITAPDKVKRDQVFEITVEVGKLRPHPNEPEHFIEWLEVWCADTFLFRTQFVGSLSIPKVTFSCKLSHAHGPLKVWAKCNLHGLWEGVKEIEVE
jgi:superoxide reductase